MAEPNKMLEETANYLLNHCFLLGGVEDQRAKYLYVQDHLPEVRAVTEENVELLARQALAARPRVTASTLAAEYPDDFARVIGLHTYSQSPRRDYDITLTGEWVERGGFRFEEFVLTPRREDGNDGRTE